MGTALPASAGGQLGRSDQACTCEACQALAAQYQGDPKLLAFYQRRLLIRGWAGSADPLEKAYILAHAPWAQSAARVCTANPSIGLVHVSNAAVQTASPVEVVAEDLETPWGGLYAAGRRVEQLAVTAAPVAELATA